MPPKARLLVVPLLLPALLACAGLVVRGELPGGTAPLDLGPADDAAPFAVDPAGARLAVVRGGLTLVELPGGSARVLGGLPRALAFSPDGAHLAAAFPSDGGSLVALFDAAGERLAEAPVAGRVDSVAWAGSEELVAGVARLERFSFGVSREESLLRWTGRDAPRLVPLGTTTIAPSEIRRLGERAERGPLVAVAPQGDAVAYTRLHDPPMFEPFVGVEVQHLAVAGQREIGRATLDVEGLAWSPEGEEVCFGDRGGLARQGAWKPGATHLGGTPGRAPALSPRGTWTLSDARVFRGEQELVAFAPGTTGQFTARGLVLRSGGRLLLLAAFAEAPPSPEPAPRRALRLELRRLRAAGELTPQAFDARLAAPAP